MPTSTDTTTIELTPTGSDAGQRLDAYVVASLTIATSSANKLAAPGLTSSPTSFSRSQIQRLIAQDRVRVAGQPAAPSTKVRAGAVVTVMLPETSAPALEPEPFTTSLLHVDDHIIVVEKPPGLVIHPGAGQTAGTLVNQLISRFPEITAVGNPSRPGIVHRLDRDTSGALVVARSAAAYEWLVAQFSARAVRKTYLALVAGAPSVKRGIIDAPVGRHPTRRTDMAVTRGGKHATTRFTVLEALGRHSLLQVTPETGRTHQIRVHLAAAGWPVVGDPQYGPRATTGQLPGGLSLPRMFLHALSLGFAHPASREPVHFEAPLAADLSHALRSCDSRWLESQQS